MEKESPAGWTSDLAESAQQLSVMTGMAGEALKHLIWQNLQLLKSTAKMSHISSSIFVGLLKEGFCTQEETQDDDGTGNMDGKFQEAEGTVRITLLSPRTCQNTTCRDTVVQCNRLTRKVSSVLEKSGQNQA